MKAKRLKNYHKQMQQYQLNFGFRQPFQALCDAEILQDSERMRLDLIGRLKGVLGGEVKIMISQCSMRHLYDAKPKNEALITHAKNFERKRCGHHELEEPLSTQECFESCIGPANKNRYVVVTQDKRTRAAMRSVPGIPIIYISKSVMVLEPMTAISIDVREQEEKAKFRAGLKGRRNPDAGQKRKYEDEDEDDSNAEPKDSGSIGEQASGESRPQKKRRAKGPKQPNPLSMRKSKRQQPSQTSNGTIPKPSSTGNVRHALEQVEDAPTGGDVESGKRKRKRKHKSKDEQTTVHEDETSVP